MTFQNDKCEESSKTLLETEV